MQISIDIDEEELQKKVMKELAAKMTSSYRTVENNFFRLAVNESVRQIVYAEKQSIIDTVVERATREIVKRALPQLMEGLIKKVEVEK